MSHKRLAHYIGAMCIEADYRRGGIQYRLTGRRGCIFNFIIMDSGQRIDFTYAIDYDSREDFINLSFTVGKKGIE